MSRTVTTSIPSAWASSRSLRTSAASSSRTQPLGVRLFGTRDNNQWQYNLAWFRRIEKDTNSGLNDLGAALRKR